MTPELIGILAVGVALAAFLGGLMTVLFQSTNRRIEALEHRIDQRFNSFEQRLNSFEERLSALEQRQARLEGMMESMRDLLARIVLPQQQ